MTQDLLRQAALAWYDSGCSIWPPMQDGTKRPAGEWKRFMNERAPRELIEAFYLPGPAQHQGIGIICGTISGNLEMLELEGRATDSLSLDAVRWEAEARGVLWLLDQLMYDGYSEWTPSGGLHFLYRVSDYPQIPGNTKLARRPASPQELEANPQDKIKTLAETRGEGGYVIVAPSGGTVHPSGDTWSTYSGKVGVIPTIKWADRCALHEAVKAALDEMPEPVFERRQVPRQVPLSADRPGDDFMIRADWADILQPHGWRVHHVTNQETFWTRPGKDRKDGWSATTGFSGNGTDDRLFVWSSSTPFDTERPYNKFGAYTLLEHGGDFGSATKALAARGYGRPAASTVVHTQSAASLAEGLVPMPVPPASTPPAADDEPTGPLKRQRDALGLPMYESDEIRYMSWDDLTVSNKWVDIHGDTFSYVATDKQWMRWDRDRWIPDDSLRHEHSVKNMVDKMLATVNQIKAEDPELAKAKAKDAKRLTGNAAIQSIIKNSRSHPNIVATPDEFDKDPNLLTVTNGVLNLSTGKLSAHDPSMRLTRRINATLDRAEPKGRWHQFMQEVLPDQEVREYLQRVCGYMLTGEASERIMILLYGESGTGKTQFLEALREVMGDFAGVTPASAFQPRANAHGPSDDLHKLRGKRLAIQSELDAGSRLNEALVKSIVGSDTQTTRPLYGKYVDWRPEYTAILATNHLPRISSSENAIWNRVKPVQFSQVFIDDQGRALNPQDRNLGRRMAQECATDILNWLLEGLEAYRERGLDEPAQVTQWLTEYRQEVDTCRQFLSQGPEDGQIVVETQATGTVREVYRSYVSWCQDNGITPLGLRNFNTRLESAGFERKKMARGITWQGIGLPQGEWIVGTQAPVGFAAFGRRE